MPAHVIEIHEGMPHAPRFRILPYVVLAGGLACRAPTAADTSLHVVIASSAATVSQVQPVTFTITVLNQSDVTAGLHASCGPHFEVKDASGRTVGPPQRFCTPTLFTPVLVSAGASYGLEDVWAGLGAPANSQVGQPLPPGSYTIIARVRARVAGVERVYVSRPITVQVTSGS